MIINPWMANGVTNQRRSEGARKIYHIHHHRPPSAFRAAKNHFIYLPNEKMPPALIFPDHVKSCMRFIKSWNAAVV